MKDYVLSAPGISLNKRIQKSKSTHITQAVPSNFFYFLLNLDLSQTLARNAVPVLFFFFSLTENGKSPYWQPILVNLCTCSPSCKLFYSLRGDLFALYIFNKCICYSVRRDLLTLYMFNKFICYSVRSALFTLYIFNKFIS